MTTQPPTAPLPLLTLVSVLEEYERPRYEEQLPAQLPQCRDIVLVYNTPS